MEQNHPQALSFDQLLQTIWLLDQTVCLRKSFFFDQYLPTVITRFTPCKTGDGFAHAVPSSAVMIIGPALTIESRSDTL